MSPTLIPTFQGWGKGEEGVWGTLLPRETPATHSYSSSPSLGAVVPKDEDHPKVAGGVACPLPTTAAHPPVLTLLPAVRAWTSKPYHTRWPLTWGCLEIVQGLLILPKPEVEKDASPGWEQNQGPSGSLAVVGQFLCADLECHFI